LGLTEAGMGMKGQIWSAASLGVLLYEGIGDTIRISLTPKPGGLIAGKKFTPHANCCRRWGCVRLRPA